MGLWPFKKREAATLTPEEKTVLAKLVSTAKYELIPLKNVQAKAEALPKGARATVTASPQHGLETTLTICEWLAPRGHEVIPHFSARMVRDKAHLTDLLARAKAAGLRKVFVVGGDAQQAGDFRDGLDLVRAIHEVGNPFEEIGVPSYPEGHVNIANDVLMQSLKDKQQYAQATTTQMSFNPEAVSEWVGKIREEGVTIPVHLGVTGPMELTKLMTIAARIGVADSARYLNKNRAMLGALMSPGSFGPDAFLEALAPTFTEPQAKITELHIFTMNQVAETAAWQQRMLEQLGAPVAP